MLFRLILALTLGADGPTGTRQTVRGGPAVYRGSIDRQIDQMKATLIGKASS